MKEIRQATGLTSRFGGSSFGNLPLGRAPLGTPSPSSARRFVAGVRSWVTIISRIKAVSSHRHSKGSGGSRNR